MIEGSFTSHPDAADLLQAVIEWLEESQPGRQGRDAYLALVARNAVAIVQRELRQGPQAMAEASARMRALLGQDGSYETLNAALAAALRDGRLAADDPRLLAHLAAETQARLDIDQPKYRASA